MWMFRRRRQRGSDYGTEDDVTALHRPLEFESGDGSELRNSSKPSPKTRVLLLVAIFCCVGCLGIGIVIGWFAHPDTQELPNNSQSSPSHDTTKEILAHLSHDNIRRHLRVLTKKPRLTGTPGEDEAVEYIAKQMRLAGLDSVEIKSYDGLLSFPNSSSPNKVQLVTSGTVVFVSEPFERGLFPGENNSNIVPPFNSYAPAGKVQGQLVYVNYGRLEDFVFLRDKMGVDFTNRIAIARYGKIFRGDKLEQAAEFGALGLILYTDPADFNADNVAKPYPDSWWMPPSGLQRGTVGADGDYLTPFYPATDSAYRRDVSDSNLPKIPCQPIGYGDAERILRRIRGKQAPPKWQGGLNFTYNIGPDMDDPDLEVVLEVNNYLERRPVQNVIGTIKGREEPDRYVLLGNHHDSWAYGAIDPLSGSAAALDISRVFGDMLKQGWRPRRTIVICSWSGEEQGLIGSTEWVEDYLNVLYDRAVAYLNVDYTVDYTYVLYAGTSPLLQDAIFAAAKKIPNPDYHSEYKTLYDVWRERLPNSKTDPNSEPEVYYSLGSGSDMATFYQRAGVPSVDIFYTYDSARWPILSYPLYHSAYETFHMFTKFIDPTFNYTVAMGQLWAILACDVADAKILPFDTTRYSTAIDKFIREKERLFKDSWEKNKIDVESLKQASKKFQESTAKFQNYVTNLKSPSELQARQINDKLMGLERAFIDPEGLPGRRIYKHIVFAPSKYDAYSDNSFPGIVDAMADIEQNKTDQWEVVKQQVSVATHVVAMAANSLDDIGL